jgi:hypothetical protein
MLGDKPALSAWVFALGKPPLKAALPDDGPSWALSALDPARYATLSTADGTVIGSETVSGRPCVIAEVIGLRGREPLHVWVDERTGALVRMERVGDPTPLLVVDGLTEISG